MRAVGTARSARRGPGVTPTLYAEMSLLRNSLLNAMREEAPVNKDPNAKNRGALRASLRAGPWETDGTHWRSVFSAAEHIRYVLHGTRPHRIEAKPGGALAFTWSGPGVSAGLPALSHIGAGGIVGTLGRRGGTSLVAAPPMSVKALADGSLVLVQAVNHPGTQANDFVSRAVVRTLVVGTPGFTKRVRQALADDVLQLIQEAL